MSEKKEVNKSVFGTLNAVDVSLKTEKKNGLTYLSWAWAWAEVKKRYPNATYTVYENAQGWCYHTDGKTAWVKTGVTIDNLEYIEYLPIMDYRNKSIPLDAITSMDVNKSIQRSITKACARHGIGLYIYAGEDLPEDGGNAEQAQTTVKTASSKNELSPYEIARRKAWQTYKRVIASRESWSDIETQANYKKQIGEMLGKTSNFTTEDWQSVIDKLEDIEKVI
jgi:hypothetical protein